MFTVPGWAAPAALKRQTDSSVTASKARTDEDSKKSKKRKRKNGQQVEITNDNIAELWQKHVEDNTPANDGRGENGKLSKRDEKRLKRTEAEESKQKRSENEHDGTGKEKFEKRMEKQKNKKQSEAPVGTTGTTDKKEAIDAKSTVDSMPPAAPPPPTTTLTPLQSSMRQKLISSRFRYLNQTLYTTPSTSSFELFKQNPTFFSEYHEGFRRQVTAWPENPVEGFIRSIRQRGRARNKGDLGSQKAQFHKEGKGKKTKGKKKDEDDDLEGVEPLPRNHRTGVCAIADLGCGDAKLAETLNKGPPNPSAVKALKLTVNSYDLAANSPLVTVADISSLPIQDGSVDMTIFSLALMGTNWISFIEEAYRVLRWKGECWISEVSSRFAPLKKSKGRVDHSVGNRTKGKANAKGDAKEKDENFETVDEVTSTPQNTTDVSSFVGVLRRRGFILEGEPDLSNKMFVRMRFIKATTPIVGKGAKNEGPTGAQGKAPKFIEAEEIDVDDETKVLKPCVYKTR